MSRAMTVEQLIRKLRGYPTEARVYFAAFDQDPGRGEAEPMTTAEEASAEARAHGYGVILST